MSEETSYIQLHSLDITYVSVCLVSCADAKATPATPSITLDQVSQRAIFHFSSRIVPGAYVLHIKYDGELNDKLAGFYRSTYTTPEGKEKRMAVTQFEATDARRALPCWDEPDRKAVFKVTLAVESHLVALSNMPVIAKSAVMQDKSGAVINTPAFPAYPPVRAGLVVHEYADSPIMSTYLLAFVVGEFDYISAMTKNQVEVRVYTALGQSHLGHFSLDVAVKSLEYFEDYFGIRYPLAKADLVAVPDFAAGAMENWGLVTYRETRLLVDPKMTSVSSMMGTARTVCHEISHMWFGNYCTMEWWTHLWLNEGFARLMEFQAVDHIFPEWNVWEVFVADPYKTALELDSLNSSHAIEVAVKNSEEINAIFDTISYAKGASVIRMLNDYLGVDFIEGVRHYLAKNAYKNCVTEDLWESLSFKSTKGVKVDKIMSSWTQQMNFPYLTVTKLSQKDKVAVYKVTQARFMEKSDEEKKAGDAKTCRWSIMLKATSSTGAHTFCFDEETAEIRIPVTEADGEENTVKFNSNCVGFFRVLYSDGVPKALCRKIADKSLSVQDRLGILDDTFALAAAGLIPVTNVLDLLQFYQSETNSSIVSCLTSNLGSLMSLHAQQPFYEELRKLVTNTFTGAYKALGWKSADGAVEASSVSQTRHDVIAILAKAGHADVIEQGLVAFRNGEKNSIPADLRGPVYYIASKHGSEKDFEMLMQIYNQSSLSEEKRRVLCVLGQTKDEDVLRKRLEWVDSGSNVRMGDMAAPYCSIACGSTQGRHLVWQHIQDNWASWYARFKGGAIILIPHVLQGCLSGFRETEKADEIRIFFEKNSCPEAERALRQTSESIYKNARQVKREQEALGKWLSSPSW